LGKFKRDVTKFVAVHKTAKEQNPSGTSEDDIFEKAKELFYLKLSRDFTYESCWRILREYPKWAMTLDEKVGLRKKRREFPGVQFGSEETGNEIQLDEIPVNFPRPQGNKAAKMELKTSRLEENALKESARAQKMMAAASETRVKILADQTMQNLFSTKLDDLDEEGQEYFRMRRQQELRKLKKQLGSDRLDRLVTDNNEVDFGSTRDSPEADRELTPVEGDDSD
jgi:hypothetical protein